MPGPRVHEYIDRLFFGKSYRKIHREMDKPFKFLGRRHRILFHDPAWAYIISSRLYPSDPNPILSAQFHIVCDKVCSGNPQFRKSLEMLARLGGREKRKKKEKIDIKILKVLEELKFRLGYLF